MGYAGYLGRYGGHQQGREERSTGARDKEADTLDRYDPFSKNYAISVIDEPRRLLLVLVKSSNVGGSLLDNIQESRVSLSYSGVQFIIGNDKTIGCEFDIVILFGEGEYGRVPVRLNFGDDVVDGGFELGCELDLTRQNVVEL